MRRIQKQFIVRKHVMATSAAEAIRNESNYTVSEVFIDEEWQKNNPIPTTNNLGFKHEKAKEIS